MTNMSRQDEAGTVVAVFLIPKTNSAAGAAVFSIRIRVFISFTGSGRNIGSVRNPLLLKGVTDASGNQTIKIIKRAHL